MGLKSKSERGTKIFHESFDDGRLTFVDTYARVDEDGSLVIEDYVDRYGEELGQRDTFPRAKAIALRKFLNKHFRGNK